MTTQPLFPAPKNTPTKARKTGIDPWLQNLLETKTGGFRAARWQRCTTCNQITLTGINIEECAWTVTVDPTPLDPHTELECLLAHRPTLSATPHGKIYELHHRDADLIADHPAGAPTTYGLVFPAHQCGNRYPGFQKPTTSQPFNPTPNI